MTVINKGNIAGISAIALWATLAIFTVELKRLPPFQFTFLSFVLATFVGVVATLRHPQKFNLWRVKPLIYLHGLYGMLLYTLCYILALRFLPPATALLINALWALLIVLFSALLPNHSLNRNHILGAIIGLSGLAILVNGLDFGVSEKAYLGVILALACAFIWSSYSVSANLLPQINSETVGGICFVASLISGALMVAFETPVYDFTFREWFALICIGLGANGIAFYTWDYAMKHGNVSFLGAVAYAAPVTGTLLLVIFGHSEGSWRLAIACGLIVLSAVIASRK